MPITLPGDVDTCHLFLWHGCSPQHPSANNNSNNSVNHTTINNDNNNDKLHSTNNKHVDYQALITRVLLVVNSTNGHDN